MLLRSSQLRLLVAALWAGSLWTIGYIVAPTLFASLSDRVLAGTIAGRLFRVEAWLSLACGLILLFMLLRARAELTTKQKNICMLLIGAMLTCTLIGYFGLQPFMAALREAAGSNGVMKSDAKMTFGILHGISSVFYLLQSILAAILLLRIR